MLPDILPCAEPQRRERAAGAVPPAQHGTAQPTTPRRLWISEAWNPRREKSKEPVEMIAGKVADPGLTEILVTVTEIEIAAAMLFALREHHMLVEGSGAVCIAAALHGKLRNAGRRIAPVVSGGNVDLSVLLGLTRETASDKC